MLSIRRLAMKRTLFFAIPFLASCGDLATAIEAPIGFVSRAGDQSIVLHWEKSSDSSLAGYRVYRSLSNSGPFVLQNTSLLTSPGFSDVTANIVNGQTYTIIFWLKADVARTVRARIGQSVSPGSPYGADTVNVTTAWQKFTWTFTSPVTDSNAQFSLNMGNAAGHVWVDAVSIQ